MTYFSASNKPLSLVSDAHITGTYKPKQRPKEFYMFFTCSIGSHFHACSIGSLMWLSPDKESTIMKKIQNFPSSQKWAGVYWSTNQLFCFCLKVSSGHEISILLLITELMKSLEGFVSRNSCTSRIPWIENFTKIGRLIGNENPIQLMFISVVLTFESQLYHFEEFCHATFKTTHCKHPTLTAISF